MNNKELMKKLQNRLLLNSIYGKKPVTTQELLNTMEEAKLKEFIAYAKRNSINLNIFKRCNKEVQRILIEEML